MVRITAEDLADDTGLLEYLSSDSCDDVETILKKKPEHATRFNQLIPEIPSLSTGFPNVVIIGNLPKPTMERYEKLRNAIALRISKTIPGISVDDLTIDLPTEENVNGEKIASGVCFVTFKKQVDVGAAVDSLNTTGVDIKHVFRAAMLDDFESILTEPQYKEFPSDSVAYYRENFRNWLADPLGREQFAYRVASGAEIMWFDGVTRSPEIVCDNHEKLGVTFFWSPQGSYFVTIHKRGIWVRADDNFQKKRRYILPSPKHILFSPDEEYMIGWDGSKPDSKTESVIIWEVYTGTKLCSLPTPIYAPSGMKVKDGAYWPFFLFSPDSKYLAMRRESDLVVYDCATMTILSDPICPGKPAPFNYPLEQFHWSPTENLLSIWIPESGDAPGRLLIVEIPTRQELASKNVFSVKNVSMHWHPQGEFLALSTVIMRKMSKKVKKEVTQIEIFRVKEKSVPVDIVDLEGYRVRSLQWERGFGASRFAILATSESSSGQSLSFFDVPTKGAKHDTKLVQSLSVPTAINSFSWSPTGQYFLASARNSDGILLFGVMNEQNKAEIIQKDEHMDLTTVQWDPSGRYVASATLSTPGDFRLSAHTEFRIYSFLGKLLYRFPSAEMTQFFWRPRPPPMISREKMDEVCKKLKEYSKRYDSQDETRRQARKQAIRDEGTELMTTYVAACKPCKDYIKSHPKQKLWEAGWKNLDQKMEMKDEITEWEEVIEVTREKVKKSGE